MFFNIDIDLSTLVDLNKQTLTEQQRLNFEFAAESHRFTFGRWSRKGITISVGGEIGEVVKNSTVEELRGFHGWI